MLLSLENFKSNMQLLFFSTGDTLESFVNDNNNKMEVSNNRWYLLMSETTFFRYSLAVYKNHINDENKISEQKDELLLLTSLNDKPHLGSTRYQKKFLWKLSTFYECYFIVIQKTHKHTIFPNDIQYLIRLYFCLHRVYRLEWEKRYTNNAKMTITFSVRA